MLQPAGLRWRTAADGAGGGGGGWLARGVGLAAVSALPPLHILALTYFWRRYARDVNRDGCSCSCWDTVFKGPYETGVAKYKHFYFNATENSLKIWILVVVLVISLYECVRRLVRLALSHQLRHEMSFLFVTSIFSHYYSWWGYVNYYNDEFFDQWYHQLFFTITELISTSVVLNLADKKTVISHRKILLIFGVATLHIIAGGWDQFYANVVLGNGQMHQIVRDVGFMVPDCLHLLIPYATVRYRAPRSLRLTPRLVIDLGITTLSVATGFWLSMHL